MNSNITGQWNVIDAGGTRTLLVSSGQHQQFNSINPASVGQEQAMRVLDEVFAAIAADGAEDAPTLLASASLDEYPRQSTVQMIGYSACRAGLRRPLVCVDDVTALLLVGMLSGGPGLAPATAVVVGTGSAARACRPDGLPVTVGSREYLASDEGSAFAIGAAGLRAGVRATDGRGRSTALVDALSERSGKSLDRLARELASTPFPKAKVAALALIVTECWAAGDEVSTQIVRGAINDLVEAAWVAADKAGVLGTEVVLAGGVLSGCPAFRKALAAKLDRYGLGRSRLVSQTAPALSHLLCNENLPCPTTWWNQVVVRTSGCA